MLEHITRCPLRRSIPDSPRRDGEPPNPRPIDRTASRYHWRRTSNTFAHNWIHGDRRPTAVVEHDSERGVPRGNGNGPPKRQNIPSYLRQHPTAHNGRLGFTLRLLSGLLYYTAEGHQRLCLPATLIDKVRKHTRRPGSHTPRWKLTRRLKFS